MKESWHEHVYDAVQKPLLLAQIAVVLEIVHGLIGLVRSPISATLPQIGLRLYVTWGILYSFPETQTHFLVSSLVISWAITELDGPVNTLHPYIHGGILARRDLKNHMEALEEHGIGTFDVMIVNLYPFYDKVSSSGGVSFDIGGPTMIRVATKNHKDVLMVVDPQDYAGLLEYLKGGQVDQQFHKKLAWKAF